MISKNEKIFLFLKERYSDIIYSLDGKLYLKDRNITTDPFTCSIWEGNDPNEYNIHIFANKFTMQLYNSNNGHKGSFHMKYDFNLSVESCLGLYRYNIDIMYGGMDLKSIPAVYDRVSIERQRAIENIINDGGIQ